LLFFFIKCLAIYYRRFRISAKCFIKCANVIFIVQSGGVLEPSIAKERSKKRAQSTYDKTKDFISEKLPITHIAKERGFTPATIISHIEKLLLEPEPIDIGYLYPKDTAAKRGIEKVQRAFEKSGDTKLTPVKKLLGAEFSYDDIRFARLFVIRDDNKK